MPMMKDSRLDDAWVQRAVAANPFKKNPDGNWTSCPVRFSWAHLLAPNPKATNQDGTPRTTPLYEVTALCPPGAQEQLDATVWPEVYAMLVKEFPENIRPDNRMPFGLHWPWHDNDGNKDGIKKQKYKGYTPGLPYFRLTSQFPPPVWDTAGNPITDARRVYAGVWGFLNFNLYPFKNKTKGVSFGLQGAMIIADDLELSGGQTDIKSAFGSVQIDANYDPSKVFGKAGPGAPPPPPGSIMPPPVAVGAPPPPPPAAPAFDPRAMLG